MTSGEIIVEWSSTGDSPILRLAAGAYETKTHEIKGAPRANTRANTFADDRRSHGCTIIG
ncbi:hypothetical protein BN2475_480032 [Paraburkholderia ribeironis]|uniref:Uncharacterized protein n=1 Tax=Paraburkholderia ribeironis TaxID=1247936 RepID=A0A1N7SB66_9BURK|nr:hypothetical protein BN2475_480032 [Paraburkholderia ribeironis]